MYGEPMRYLLAVVGVVAVWVVAALLWDEKPDPDPEMTRARVGHW